MWENTERVKGMIKNLSKKTINDTLNEKQGLKSERNAVTKPTFGTTLTRLNPISAKKLIKIQSQIE